MKIAVIGAGIFGSTIALLLSENNYDVTIFDKEKKILDKASKCNHNRLHFGFHYPRSMETATQSLDGFDLFKTKFTECIVDGFPNYYMVEKNGKIDGKHFLNFCNLLKLEYKLDYPLNDEIILDNIELSIKTNEPVFDFNKIRKNLNQKLILSNVNLKLGHDITDIKQLDEYEIIINATYCNINKINDLLGLKKTHLKLQDVMIPIFEYDHRQVGLTIMDGEFCSIMPKGFEKNMFLLYHVKESVINQKIDFFVNDEWVNSDKKFIEKKINDIYEKSSIYYPFLNKVKKIDYYRTTRALPINDNDERLNYLKLEIVKEKKIITLLSGKITTCWSTANKILDLINENNFNR